MHKDLTLKVWTEINNVYSLIHSIKFLIQKELDENDDGKPLHVIPVCDPLVSVLEFGNGN